MMPGQSSDFNGGVGLADIIELREVVNVDQVVRPRQPQEVSIGTGTGRRREASRLLRADRSGRKLRRGFAADDIRMTPGFTWAILSAFNGAGFDRSPDQTRAGASRRPPTQWLRLRYGANPCRPGRTIHCLQAPSRGTDPSQSGAPMSRGPGSISRRHGTALSDIFGAQADADPAGRECPPAGTPNHPAAAGLIRRAGNAIPRRSAPVRP